MVAAVLVGLVAVWIVVEVLALRPGYPHGTEDAAASSDTVRRRGPGSGGGRGPVVWGSVVRQRARVGRNSSVVQVGGDLTVPPANRTG
jgi:hypothetical protein